ncbi:hypothetical protein [Maribacter halichondriae]|uniref:hypothetical protein n=1 Tax=Maribacter halichondriae TaxID=2980554 RepID=UPI0023591579|nr:hypothetical protein [Maribacter sp. Hal144]
MTQISFKSIILALCLISISAYGQKQTKTFKESFKVNPDAILDINTSHADIEFETWNKDEVLVEATIEIDGVSDADADAYFTDGAIEILGNSKKITISTGGGNGLFFSNSVGGFNDFDFHFDYPLLPDMDSLLFDTHDMHEFPELFEVPPMPRMPRPEFDYEAFRKDGKEYLEKWQKEFSKGFDKEYEEKLERWAERMDARRQKREDQRALMKEKREESRERMMEKRAEMNQRRAEMNEKRRALLEERRNLQHHTGNGIKSIIIQSDSLNGGQNMYYFSTGGENKKYKVKKTIKVKLPKSVKIKMNVRHGDVKLAENTKNINATLSYANLLATTIDGDATIINASYSPVSVQNWNYGQLQTSYSDNVNLKEVLNLRLSATSSDVVIDRLLKSAYIKNDLGPLRINAISKDFEDLDISLQNAELDCELPSSSYTIYVNGISSKFSCPSNLKLERTENLNSFIQKGYHITKNTDRSITINSKYSNVSLDEK